MAPLPDYVAGTITLTNGNTAFTGSGTGWLAAGFREGDTILGIEDNEGVVYVIETIDDNDAGTLTQPWQGATGTYTYRMRYLSDGQRVTAQARQLIELLGNGNIQALAGLDGTPQTVPTFVGPGAMIETPLTDLVTGLAFDEQVDDLADRATYDGQPAGFVVLVNDVGDGRSAIYSKLTNASGDWSDPAYITGPVGPMPELSAGTVTRGDFDATLTPVTGGYELDLTIPAQTAQGDYSGATAYVTGDVVQNEGSSWVALQSTTGNAPPSLPATSNAYWQLVARAGNDGAGTVTALVAGDGVDIDSTDPTQPVVSGVVFSEDESGDVPGPTSANITDGALLSASGGWVSGATVRTAINAISGIMVKTTVYTTSGTHTFDTNCVCYTLDLVGGGGGGGGTNTTAGDASACTGGGSGGDWSGVVSGNIQPSATIVIGAGGGSGANGGESSYSDGVRSVTCPGGLGGGGTNGAALPTQTEVLAVTPTQSGWSGSDQLMVFSSAQGSPRANGIGSTCLGGGRSWGYGSQGGSTRFGIGGAGSVSGAGSSQSAPGRPGTGFGAGGGGAAPVNGANNSTGGGAGSGGMCKIVEFIKVP